MMQYKDTYTVDGYNMKIRQSYEPIHQAYHNNPNCVLIAKELQHKDNIQRYNRRAYIQFCLQTTK